MKASTKLQVTDSMLVEVRLTMTVHEMTYCILALKDYRNHSAGTLLRTLQQSLQLAAQSHEAEHRFDGGVPVES